jgi:NTE family protein
VGFLRGLFEASPDSFPYDFCFFSGVSVGALNASFLAQHGSFKEAVTALEAIWDSIQGDSDVYTVPPLLGEKGAIVAALFTESGIARDAIYGSRPLARLIADHVSWPKLEQAAREGRLWAVGATSLTDGCYYLITNSDPLLRAGLKKHQGQLQLSLQAGGYGSVPDRVQAFVLASASMPLLFPPVDVYDHRFIDGGIRDVTPLSAAFLAAAEANAPLEEIVVVNCSPESPPYRTASGLDSGREIIDRALELMVNEIMRNDIDTADRVNRLVHRGVTEKNIPVRVVWPEQDFGLGSLEFSALAKRKQLREHGRQTGLRF